MQYRPPHRSTQKVVKMQTRSALVSPDDVTGFENLAKAAATRA